MNKVISLILMIFSISTFSLDFITLGKEKLETVTTSKQVKTTLDLIEQNYSAKCNLQKATTFGKVNHLRYLCETSAKSLNLRMDVTSTKNSIKVKNFSVFF